MRNYYLSLKEFKCVSLPIIKADTRQLFDLSIGQGKHLILNICSYYCSPVNDLLPSEPPRCFAPSLAQSATYIILSFCV